MWCYQLPCLLFACFTVVVIIFKLFMKLTTVWDRSPTCLCGKTAIVTGANTGIGFYTAQDFATRGARVILACRDRKKAEEARAKLVEATGNPNIVARNLDLASLDSVRKFAKEIITTEDRLNILVNNAGAWGFDHQITKDGLSLSMQINHFGPFLLTLLLVDLLKKSTPSRIVNVSSDAAHFAYLNLKDLNAPVKGLFATFRDYGNTKLCNMLSTNELARKLKDSGVDVNLVNPGLVQTDIIRNFSTHLQILSRAAAIIFYKTAEEGAQTSIFVAVSKKIRGVSGEYFAECRKGWMPTSGRNEALAKKVWKESEKFVKLAE